jgi:hypothetical protein
MLATAGTAIRLDGLISDRRMVINIGSVLL